MSVLHSCSVCLYTAGSSGVALDKSEEILQRRWGRGEEEGGEVTSSVRVRAQHYSHYDQHSLLTFSN